MSLNAHALVIGVSQYRHIRPLPHAADAVDLAAILRDPSACGYDAARVMLLEDAAATRAAILGGLDHLAEHADATSTVLLYFSGHGGRPTGRDDSYLMPCDGRGGSPDEFEATAISSKLLGTKLAALRAERLTVILDCCHAAGLAHPRDIADPWLSDLDDGALGALARGRGRVVMAASRGDGAAYIVAGARHGLFTEHLLAGLRGAAGGSDGFVRVLDLYHHIQRSVVARDPSQRPVLKTELEDNYPLATFPVDARAALTAVAPPTRFAYDVLVVHAPDDRDRAWARSLIHLLEDRGIRVGTEERDAEPGSHRVAELDRLVSTSRYTMPILTPRFSAGRFQHLQTVMAEHLGVEDGIARLIPIVREPCEARLGLRSLVHLDMIRDENVAPNLERLIRTLRKAAATPSPAAAH